MAASDATAMAEILGIAPPASPSVSGSASPAIAHQGISSASIPPVSFSRQVVEPIINGPKEDGWPTAPPRAFPTFASSSSTGLAATFAAPVVVDEVVSSAVEGETEKQKEKREKKERKELKKKGREVAATVVEVATKPSTFPMFAASSTAGLAATFEESPAVVEPAKKEKKKRSRSDEVVVEGATVGVDEAERKRAKKARKAERKAAKQ